MSQPSNGTLIAKTPNTGVQSAHICSMCLASLERGRYRSIAATAAAPTRISGRRFVYLEPLAPKPMNIDSSKP